MHNRWKSFRATDWFETVHPMTYYVVLQSLVWAIFVLFVLVVSGDALFDHHTEIWPEPMAYVWAVLAIGGAIWQLFSLMRDSFDRRRMTMTIWRVARFNLAIWTFSLLLWWYIDEYEMLIVTMFGMATYAYIALAKRLHRVSRRI